ncbi:MAG: hypothetical protein Q9224_004187 [Gallowayella concinna]
MSQERPAPPPLTKNDVAREYLTAYNSVCALLWLSVFARVVVVLPITGVESVYEAAGDFTKWTQTVAVLEILHSAFGVSYSLLSLPILVFRFTPYPGPVMRVQYGLILHSSNPQASSAPLSQPPLSKSYPASSSSGPSSTKTPSSPPPQSSTAPCFSPGRLQKSSDTAISCSISAARCQGS